MHIPIYSAKDGGYKLVFVQGSKEQANELGREELTALQEKIRTALNEPERDDEALPDNRHKLSKLKHADYEGFANVLKETTVEDFTIILKYADDPELWRLVEAHESPRGMQMLRVEMDCLPPVTVMRARQAIDRIIYVADEYEKMGMLKYMDTPLLGMVEENAVVQTEAKLEDYIAYVGKNSGYYLERFRKFRQPDGDAYAFTWNWPACIVPVFWLLYRKLYSWAAIAFIVNLIVPVFSNIAWAAVANYIYYKKVWKEVRINKSIFLEASAVSQTLSMKGGVNEWVIKAGYAIGIIAVVSVLAFILWGLR